MDFVPTCTALLGLPTPAGLHGKSFVPLLADADENGPTIVQMGTFRFNVIKRGDRYGLRVKDAEAETRTHFKGLESYPIDPKWRTNIHARFVSASRGAFGRCRVGQRGRGRARVPVLRTAAGGARRIVGRREVDHRLEQARILAE